LNVVAFDAEGFAAEFRDVICDLHDVDIVFG